MHKEHRPALVYWVLAAGMMSFSFSPILIRFAGSEIGGEAHGLTVAVWRTVMAVVALAPFAWVRVRTEIKAFERREWYLILSAGVLLGMHFVLWIESLYHTTVAAASVLVTTSPVFLAVLGYIFLKERLSKPINGAILVAVAGAATIGMGDMLEGVMPERFSVMAWPCSPRYFSVCTSLWAGSCARSVLGWRTCFHCIPLPPSPRWSLLFCLMPPCGVSPAILFAVRGSGAGAAGPGAWVF